MKQYKIEILVVLFAMLCRTVFADVFIKDIDGSKVEIYFSFTETTAQKVNLAGTMNGWSTDATPMIKNENGIWEYVLSASISDEIIYKFVVNGNIWTHDINAPEEVDDGYGGNNGLINVAQVLAMQTKKNDQPSSTGTSTKIPPKNRKFQFETETYFINNTEASSDSGKFEIVRNALDTQSVWKFSGDIFTNTSAYVEFTAFKSSNTIWKKNTLAFSQGIDDFAGGILFGPLAYFSTGNPLDLGKICFGFDFPYFNFKTAYGEAGIPSHLSVLWETADKNIKADQGYVAFFTGEKLLRLGDFSVDAAIIPNRILNGGNYGILSWFKGSYKKYTIDLEYAMRSAEKTDASRIFKNIPRQDIVAGFAAGFGDFGVKIQAMGSVYTQGGAAMQRPAGDRFSGALIVSYDGSRFGLNGGTAYRGEIAALLYGGENKKQDAVLKNKGTFNMVFNGYFNISDQMRFSFETNTELAAKNTQSNNVCISLKPRFSGNFTARAGKECTLDMYIHTLFNTKPALTSKKEVFVFAAAGFKIVYDFMSIFYSMENSGDVMFNSLLADFVVIKDLHIQAGAVLRTGKDVKNPGGAVVGVYWTIPCVRLRLPIIFTQVLFNMDPYKAAHVVYDLDVVDYNIKGGSSVFDGKSALRIGIRWEF